MAKCTKKCCNCQSVVGSGEFSKCRAPQNIDKAEMKALELVGMDNIPNKYRIDYASMQREAGWIWSRIEGRCGKEGLWYVPKEEK